MADDPGPNSDKEIAVVVITILLVVAIFAWLGYRALEDGSISMLGIDSPAPTIEPKRRTTPGSHLWDVRLITMKRRTVLQLLPVAALPNQLVKAADLCAANGGSRFENYTFAFFTADEAELAASLMEIIIPADENSPGAKQARTAAFADLMLSTGPQDAQKRWREGLELFRLEAARTSLESAIAKAAQEETDPKTDLARFFVALKRTTVDGYYTSEVGIHQDLKYQGNQHLTASPRCEHPEHKSPAPSPQSPAPGS